MLKYNMSYQFYYFCREELDFTYQLDGTSDNRETIRLEHLQVVAQHQEHVLAVCKQKAEAAQKTPDCDGQYKLQVFHSLFCITVRAAKLACKTLMVNTSIQY